MQNIFRISESWHDPVPGLKRTITLIFAVLIIESFSFLGKGQPLPFHQIYLLGLLRTVDVFVLLTWGPLTLERIEISEVLRDALGFTFLVSAAGIIFLACWKFLFGSSMLKLGPGLFHQSVSTRIAFYVTSCVVSPIAEELFFRGLIYRKLREKYGAWICIFSVSVLFAFTHYYFNRQVMQALMPFLGSLIFCLGYEKAKFILTPILLHIFGNLIIFLSPFLGFL